MLFNISKETLELFLSARTNTFKVIQSTKSRTPETSMQLVIWRQGLQILIGNFIEYTKASLMEWDNIICYTTNYNGAWELTAASFGRYTRQNVRYAWADIYTRCGIDRESIANTKKEKEELAGSLAEYILQNKLWNADLGHQWEIETT